MRGHSTHPENQHCNPRSTIRPALLAVSVWLVVAGAGFPPQSSTGLTSPQVSLHGATPDQQDRIEWALEEFEAANLALPGLDITFHDTRAGCDDNTGLVRSVDGVADIEICMPTRHIILHELAHAWAWQAVSDETRAAFTEYWGLNTWNDHNADWKARATEKAADTIAFTLSGPPANPSATLQLFFCAYPLLTGDPLPFADPPFESC